MTSFIDTAPKRAKLPPRKNPYWVNVGGSRGGINLGYRTGRRYGCWVAKIVAEGERVEERLGNADDPKATSDVLTYKMAVSKALEWGRQQYSAIEARSLDESQNKTLTVASAVETYVKARKQKSQANGKHAENWFARYVLPDDKFANTKLSKLRAKTIDDWRATLPDSLMPATINRLLSDLRAALNMMAEKHRRELSPYLPGEIRIGTKALSVESKARKQILTEYKLRRLIHAAYEIDPDGDFGNLILVAAATGARHSQLKIIKVGDVQLNKNRILVPASKKGRSAVPKAPTAFPLNPDVIERLRPIVTGRNANEFLLMRWELQKYRENGLFKWRKVRRRPWRQASDMQRLWGMAINKAGIAGAVPYALRHTSIVRNLVANLPIKLVASLHDTSTKMIEDHYAAYIVDATQELARAAALNFSGRL